MAFVGRFSGVIAYSDDSSDQFAAHIDERGIISVNSGVNNTPNESNRAILEVQANQPWLQDILDLVTGVTNPITLSPTGVAVKTVTSAVLHYSGRISRTDDTWEDFAVQYDIKAAQAYQNTFILNSSGSGNGDVSAQNEVLAGVLIPWFEALVGSGNVTL